MSLTLDEFLKALDISAEQSTALSWAMLYPKIFINNSLYINQDSSLLFQSIEGVFNLRDTYEKSNEQLTARESFFLGFCYIVAGQKGDGVLHVANAAYGGYFCGQIPLGLYYLYTGETNKGISCLEKAAPNNSYIYHYLGRLCLLGRGGVEQNDETALSYFSTLDKIGITFTTDDPEAPSTSFCINTARTNISIKRIESLIQAKPTLTDNAKSNAHLKTLHKKLHSNFETFQDNMKSIPAATGKPVASNSLFLNSDKVYLTDEPEMRKKQNNALNEFKAACRKDINDTIGLLDKGELNALDYCLNLLKAIMDVAIRVFSLGLAKSSLFSYTHVEPAQQLVTLKDSLSAESLLRKP